MKILINTDDKTLEVSEGGERKQYSLYSREAFEEISRQWLKVGWDQRYSYTFSWFGRPIVQLPEDIVRMQEVIHALQPDVIIETGVAHGGSLIFYAGLCKVLGKGRVIGIDIEIRPHNRRAIEGHPLADAITLIEGSSVAPEVLRQLRSLIGPKETVLVILDSDHSRAHVAAELEAYHGLITPGSYIVATDGLMRDLGDVPRGFPEWRQDNPAVAAEEFASRHPEFILEQPAWPFNESRLEANVTHWPKAWLRRR